MVGRRLGAAMTTGCQVLRRLCDIYMIGVVLMGLSGAVTAHHSYASFDMTQSASVSGVVSQWEWTNPHSFLHVLVTDHGDQPVEWIFESSSPALLARNGLTRNTFKEGDRLTVTYHPSRATPNRGSLETATFAGGQMVSIHKPTTDSGSTP